MSLRTAIVPYIDGNGLVAPNIVPQGQLQGSDNGVLFTSEYYTLLLQNNELLQEDITAYKALIESCIGQGLLNRVPVGQNDGLEGPDDYYGALNACAQLSITDIPQTFLKAAWKYKGALDNVSPGTWSWQSFLVRQPALLTAMIAASYPNSWGISLLATPLFFITAIIIATSGMFVNTDDSTSRLLAWNIIGATQSSWLCRLASKIWYWRLKKQYGSTGMQAVATIYFPPGHPFIEYWKK